MNVRFILGLLAVGWFLSQSPLTVAEDENPYAPIITRNVFGLVPIPTNPPAVDPASLVPPPKITPNGIMTLFGKLQVLFKVAGVARPGQPPKDESYVMCEGDRQDDIEVQKIDENSATITFNNHGMVQELALVAGTATGGDAAPAPAGFPQPPGIPMPRVAPGSGPPMGFGGRFGRNRNVPGANNPGAGGTQEQQMTPEQSVILIEAQRQKYLQEGNPAFKILPPTPLTSQVIEENGGDGSESEAPMPGR